MFNLQYYHSVCRYYLFAGLWFIASNFVSVSDEKQHSPIGFDIIFPGMIEYAKELDLNLPLGQRDVDAMLQKRDLELKGYISVS